MTPSDIEDGPYRSEPLWNEGQAIARYHRDNGDLYAMLGAMLGGIVGGLAGAFDRRLGIPAALLGAFTLFRVGRAFGKRQRRDFCSARGCTAWLAPDVARCPQCGGRILMEIVTEADERAWRKKEVPSDAAAAAEVAADQDSDSQ